MTLDDETAERIAGEKARERGDYNGVGQTIPLGEYVKAGYAARDAEVEELRAEVERLRDAVESTDRMVESFEKWCTRALTAEATLAKVREWADEHPSTGTLLAILDESPTERETPATPETEFRFTDDQWRAYQAIPEQGYSHRGWIESVVNRWLAERETPADEWEYRPGRIRADGRVRITSPTTIAPDYVRKYMAEGGDVVRRRVGPWEVVPDDRA